MRKNDLEFLQILFIATIFTNITRTIHNIHTIHDSVLPPPLIILQVSSQKGNVAEAHVKC
jgi:hypothetical protein